MSVHSEPQVEITFVITTICGMSSGNFTNSDTRSERGGNPDITNSVSYPNIKKGDTYQYAILTFSRKTCPHKGII